MNKIKISLIAAAALVASAGCSQNKPANGYVITGTIKDIDSGMVKLMRQDDSNRTSKAVDSAMLKNGTFELRGKADHPEMMSLQFTPGNWGMRLFVENSKIRVDIDTAGAEYYDYTAYGMEKGASLKKVEVSGSKVNDAYNQYENDPKQLEFKAAFASINKMKGVDHEVLRAKSDSVGQLYKAWQLNYINDFVAKNPGSVAGLYMFSNYYLFESSMPIANVEAMLGKFSSEAKGSMYYANLIKDLQKRKRVLPGKQAPEFTLLKRDSSSFNLSATRGKYVMIDFWASWCKPCREAIPHWKEVYQKYKDKGFEIVSVSNDARWKDWFQAMDQEKMPWIQLCDEFPVKNMTAKVATLYQIPSLPSYVLLDKDGKILVHTIEEKEIDSKLAEVFH